MFRWQTHRQRRREWRDFYLIAAMIGIAPFLSGSTSVTAEQDVRQNLVQGDSTGQQNGRPTTGGWIVEDHPSIGMRGTASSKPPSVVWTSPGGAPDNLLPVIGPRLELPGHLEMAWKVAVSPDNTLLASSDSVGRRIRLWSLDEGRLVAAYEPHTAMIMSLAFSPDGRFLASAKAPREPVGRGAGDGFGRIWAEFAPSTQRFCDADGVGRIRCCWTLLSSARAVPAGLPAK